MNTTEKFEQHEGTLSRIRYHVSAFFIGVLHDGTTVKGHMLSPQVGLSYAFRGSWEHHPRYGKQFAFEDSRVSYPTDLEAIRSYLIEHCRWIGPTISRRLVQTYGEDTLRICKEDPDRVTDEITGLTKKRAQEIAVLLRKNEADEQLQLALKDLLTGTSVSRGATNRILEKWGSEAPARVRENPYGLVGAIAGIGFLTADDVARKIGYEQTSTPRLRAGILHTLTQAALANGHTCLPRTRLLTDVASLLEVSKDHIEAALNALEEEGSLVRVNDLVGLKQYHDDEQLIADKLKALAAQSLPASRIELDGLAQDQQDAVARAITTSVSILTGVPGTGKTHAIKRIIEAFPDDEVALAAPSGKAAKRMFEQTGHPASTIHRLLEPQMSSGRFVFTRNATCPIKADLIVLDEVSMVDVWLMARFLEAVAPGTRLILVGDTHQLPSVGPGNILKDLIASKTIPCSELTQIKRQEDGLIIRACHRIKNGQDLRCENSTASDFFFLSRDSEGAICETLLELVGRRLPARFQADPLRDIQIITPLREKTRLSCKSLNAICQRRLNLKPEIPGCRFKIGDKVIQTKNRYALEFINGDIGYVRLADEATRKLTVAFEAPERIVELSFSERDLELAYATTAHRFQGSEVRIVVIPIHRAFGPLIMQRNWLYTAVSRAKEVCVLVGHRHEIPRIISRNQQQRRFTRLAELFR